MSWRLLIIIGIVFVDIEPLNLMFCEESEYSLAAAADSGDENVMEGGLTIRQQQYQRCDGSSRLPRVRIALPNNIIITTRPIYKSSVK